MDKYIIRNIQLIRAIAFLCICFSHFGDGVGLPAQFSRWGVALFFVLSGFLCMIHGSHLNNPTDVKSSISYAIRKIRRLYPILAVTTFLSCIIELIHFRNQIRINEHFLLKSVTRLVTDMLLICDWFPRSDYFQPYNIVVWFLSALFLMYIITPKFINFLNKIYGGQNKKPRTIVLGIFITHFIAILQSVVYMETIKDFWWYVYQNPLIRIGDYLIGMQVGCLFNKIKQREKCQNNSVEYIRLVAMASIAIFLNITFLIIHIKGLLPNALLLASEGVFYSLPVAMLIFFVSLLDEYIDSKFFFFAPVRFLLFVGDVSAYAFLIHVPVINIVHGILSKTVLYNDFFWVSSSLILIICISYMVRYVHIRSRI